MSISAELPEQSANTVRFIDIMDIINIGNKYPGRYVFNSDTNKPVYATGPLPGDVWVDATSTLAHTPI